MYTPPFTITDKILMLVAEISESLGALSVLMEEDAPHPMLRKQNRIKTIQSSLAIENNSLSVEQVTDIIEGRPVLGTMREIQEVKGAVGAYERLDTLDAFSEKDLLKSHGLMMAELVHEAGRYRSGNVGVYGPQGCVHIGPPPMRVPILMADLFRWLKSTTTHPLISSCVFHYEFEFIHPFADGNGRMGRLWQTALLARWKPVFAWLPVEIIVKEHQQAYYDAIAQSDKEANSTVFIEFMLGCILQAIDDVVSPKASSNMSPKDIILDLIRQVPKVTIADMALALGMSKRNAQRHVNMLVEEQCIRRVGTSRNGHWEIIAPTKT